MSLTITYVLFHFIYGREWSEIFPIPKREPYLGMVEVVVGEECGVEDNND